MRRIFKYAVLIFALVTLVGCDQVAKDIARQKLAGGQSLTFVGSLVRFTYVENPGTFLGLGGNWDDALRWSIYGLSCIVVLASIFFLFVFADRLGRLRTVGLLILLSGAGGNLVDRFVNHGRVIDFIVVGVGQIHTGVFNLADVFIGVGLMVFLFGFRKHSGSGCP